MPIMQRLILATIVAALAAIAVACDGSDEPEQPTPTPFVAPAEGFVYAHVTRGGFGGAPEDVYRIAVFDSQAMADVAAFEVTGPVGYPSPSIILARDEVLVNHGDRLTAYTLDGTASRDIRTAEDGGHIAGFDVSPDNATLAVTEWFRDPCPTPSPGASSAQCEPFRDVSRLVFIETDTGDVIRELRQEEPPLDALPGYVQHVFWWSDGNRITAHGVVNPEGPGTTAVVTPDGDVRVSSIRDYHPERPDGRYMFTGERLEACQLALNRIELAIIDLMDDSVATSARDETRLVNDYYWSPDGSELLFSTVSFTEQPASEVLGEGSEGVCQIRDEQTEQWSVLHVDGSPTETGVDMYAVFDRWYGDNLLTYICDGERVRAVGWCLDEGNLFSAGTYAPADVWFRGQHIANTKDFELLGYLN
jgi:hypothetical protein